MKINCDEVAFIQWYRRLTRLEQIAARAALVHGDDRLVEALRRRGKCLHCPIALTMPESEDNFPLLVGEVCFD